MADKKKEYMWESLDVYKCLNVAVWSLLVHESAGISIVSDVIATRKVWK